MCMPRENFSLVLDVCCSLRAMYLILPSLQMAALVMPGHRSRHCLLTWAALTAQWCSFNRRVLVSECRSAHRSICEVSREGCDNRNMFVRAMF